MVDQVTPYEDVAWDRVVRGRHPLEVILGRQMHVYYKVDQSKYFAHALELGTPATVVDQSGCKEARTHQRAESLPSDSILLLRLTENQVDEIRVTGVCLIEAFTRGGLTRRYRPKPAWGKSKSSHQATQGDGDLFTPIDFSECLLFEKAWAAKPAMSELPESAVISEQRPAQLKVRSHDLFLHESDIDLLFREGVSAWHCVPYPLRQKGLSYALYWAYQASIAANRDQVPMPNGVMGWLRDNAPENAYAIRGIRTLSSMVRFDYKFRREFDQVSLDGFSKAQGLSDQYISKPIRLLMDISDWWLDHRGYDDVQRFELWKKLVDAGFRNTVIRNMMGVITGQHPTRREWDVFKYLLHWKSS